MRPAEHRLRLRAPAGHPAGGVDRHDRVEGGLHDQPGTLLAFAQGIHETPVRDRDGQLGGRLLRDADLLLRKLRLIAAEADRADQVATGDHWHHHVRGDTRGEEGLGFVARRERVDVYHLRLAPSQGLDVAGELQRVANAGPAMDAATPHRHQPLHLARAEIEQIDDGAGRPEQIPQASHDRLRDRHGLLRGNDHPVDVMEEVEALGGLGEGRLALAQRVFRAPALGDFELERPRGLEELGRPLPYTLFQPGGQRSHAESDEADAANDDDHDQEQGQPHLAPDRCEDLVLIDSEDMTEQGQGADAHDHPAEQTRKLAGGGMTCGEIAENQCRCRQQQASGGRDGHPARTEFVGRIRFPEDQLVDPEVPTPGILGKREQSDDRDNGHGRPREPPRERAVPGAQPEGEAQKDERDRRVRHHGDEAGQGAHQPTLTENPTGEDDAPERGYAGSG